jgi:hypothetical protein
MKFMKFILIIFVLFELAQLRELSQSPRNYRKRHTDPSNNPIPEKWDTGSKNERPSQSPRKYAGYVSQSYREHEYKDHSNEMRHKARARMILR